MLIELRDCQLDTTRATFIRSVFQNTKDSSWNLEIDQQTSTSGFHCSWVNIDKSFSFGVIIESSDKNEAAYQAARCANLTLNLGFNDK